MEEQKKKMISEISRRVTVLYALFTIVAICVFMRIGYVQFLSRETATNAERLRKTIIFKDTTSLQAHRGSILARDGKPLATSIFRQSVYFDFGSEGFDNRERFLEDADSLSKLLAAYFRDKSATEYYRIMTTEHDRCFRLVRGRDTMIMRSEGRIAQWFDMLRGEAWKTVRIHDTVRTHSYTRLFRDIDFNEWQTLKTYPILDESLGRVYQLDKHDFRVYPHDELALRTIGRIGVQTPYGIEEAYREQLQGHDGYQWLQCIAPRFYSRVDGADYEEPEDGLDVVTTLDVDVQDVAAKALRRQLQDEAAIWGTSIVMECATGDILAMVNLGRNSKGEFVENRNYALGARLEPGSTFKLAAALALIEDKDFTLDRVYDTGHGRPVLVGESKTRVVDSHNIGGNIDMLTAFSQSANVWFTKAVYESYKNEPQRYVDFLKSLHLDRTVGLENLGELQPQLYEPKDKYKGWYPHTTLVNMGYGYGLYLSPIHTLTLYNAVANGGRMVAPRLVMRIMRGNRTVEEFPTETLVDKICSRSTLATVRQCLEEVALTGTAKEYFGEKRSTFRVGAKTGTAKVAQGGIKYSDGYFLGSMVTYLPADKPRYTVMTAIYKRRGGGRTVYGAGLAGPVQKRIATFLYNRDTNWAGEVADSDTDHYPTNIKGGDIAKIRKVASRFSPRTTYDDRTGWGRTKVESDATVAITTLDDNRNTMPNVIGMGLSDAIFILENRGLKVAFTGSGKVVGQSVAAGTGIRRGDRVTLKLK